MPASVTHCEGAAPVLSCAWEVSVVVAALIGFIFGFIGSMPIAGPISALIFARALQGRGREGLHIGLGAAVAEMIYAGLAFWGFAELLERYAWLETLSNAAAAIILLGLALYFIRYDDSELSPQAQSGSDERSALRGILAGFTIVALNPTLLATWTAASATLLSSGFVTLNSAHALPFGLGAFVGIVLWFVTLVRLLTHFRERFSPASLARVIRATGWMLLFISAWFAWRLVA